MPRKTIAATDIYDGRDPLDIPRYTFAEAAAYARVKERTLTTWVRGRTYPVANGSADFLPIIKRPDSNDPRLSFLNVAEAYVLRSLRTAYGLRMNKVRDALRYAENRHGIQRLLISKEFAFAPGKLFLDRWEDLVDLSQEGQAALRPVWASYLNRFDWTRGRPFRFYLLTRAETDTNAPRFVFIDPRVAFGDPVVAPKAVRASTIADRVYAGEDPADVARDYGLETGAVIEAIRTDRLKAEARAVA